LRDLLGNGEVADRDNVGGRLDGASRGREAVGIFDHTYHAIGNRLGRLSLGHSRCICLVLLKAFSRQMTRLAAHVTASLGHGKTGLLAIAGCVPEPIAIGTPRISDIPIGLARAGQCGDQASTTACTRRPTLTAALPRGDLWSGTSEGEARRLLCEASPQRPN
jgi:hypothetical protein